MSRTLIDASLIAPFSTTFIGLGRNRIINGETLIDQANAGTDLTVNANATFYSVDQFLGVGVNAAGVFVLASDGVGPAGFTSSLRATCTTADASIGATDSYRVSNYVEGYSVRDFNLGTASAKTFTLSFWAISSLTGTYSGAFQNGNSDRSYTFEYVINSPNTWEFKTVTVAGDVTGTWVVTAGYGLIIHWALAMGSNFTAPAGSWGAGDKRGTANQVNFMSSSTTRTWAITGVQLELGTSATQFEYVPIPILLLQCQRYYEKNYVLGNKPGSNVTAGRILVTTTTQSSGQVLWPHKFAVYKRAAPTMTYYLEAGTSGSWNYGRSGASGTTPVGTDSAGNSAVIMNPTTLGANFVAAFVSGFWVADSRL